MSYWLSSTWLEAVHIISVATVISQLPYYVIGARTQLDKAALKKPVVAWIVMVLLPVFVSFVNFLPTGPTLWVLLVGVLFGVVIIGIGLLIARTAVEAALATQMREREGAQPAGGATAEPAEG